MKIEKFKKVLFCALIMLAAMNLFSLNGASASPLVPSPNPPIPADVKTYLETCSDRYSSTKQSPAVSSWISPSNNAQARDMEVDFGTPSIALQLNYAGAYCVKPSKAVETRYKVSAVNTAGVSGLAGEVSVLNYPGSTGPSGSYNYTKNDFTYSPSGGFTKTGTYNVAVQVIAINRFEDGSYYCVGPGGQVNGFDYSKCGADGRGFSIQVNVKEPPDGQWELAGTSAVAPQSGSAGSTAVFTHKITNKGPQTASGWIYVTHFVDYNASGTKIGQGSIAALSNTTGSASLTNGQTVTKTDNYVIPTSWTAGYKRCEYISYDNYKSPTPPQPTYRSSTTVCFTVTAAGTPQVNLSCTSSGGTYTLSGSATDSDKAGPLTLEFYKSGSPINTGVTSTGSNGTFSVNITSFMGSPPSTSNFSVTAKGVNSAGALAPPDGSDSVTCNVAPPTGGGGSFCPGDVKISGNTQVDVPLPDQTPPGRTAPPSGFTTNPYATYEQDIPTGKTTVTAVNDISSGGARINVPQVPGSNTYENVKLEYRSYVDGMPYDPNQASVTYDSEYKRTDWYVVFDHNQCDGRPATLNGNQCNYSYSAPSYQACNSGYYDYGAGQCLSYAGSPTCPTGSYQSGGSCYKNSDGTYTGAASCSSGTMYYGSCYNTSSSYTVYYCYDSNETRSGTTCYGSYNATAYYRWTNNGTYTTTKSHTVNAYAMNKCFDRNFEVTNVNVGASYNDPEDPSTVSATASTDVNFTIPSGFPAAPNGLRTSVRVNLSYTISSSCSMSPGSGSVTVFGGNLPSSGSSALQSSSCPVEAPPLQAGDRVCVTYTVSPGIGSVRIDGTPVNASGSRSGTGCTGALTDAPYVHILGQDAVAGGAFANGMSDQCSSGAMSGGSLRANFRTTGAQTRGSGSQYAAMAQGVINGFASGTLKTSVPTAARGLSFGNNPNTSPTGNIGAPHCVPDYFSTRPADVQTLTSGDLNQFNGGNKSGAYAFNNDLTLSYPGLGSGGGIQKGNRIAIYVIGDVFISENITYKKTGWANPEDIPSLYVIARGNIYISPNVTELDGIFVAQPSGSGGGEINTCAPGFGRFGESALYDSCRGNKLMVNGAFIARDINFLRTFSSLRTSLGGEQPRAVDNAGPCTGNVRTGTRSASDVNHDCAAEIINFSPETYLSEPSMLPVGGPAVGKYDYITSLSPVL